MTEPLTLKEKEERATFKIKLREINLTLTMSNFPNLPDLTIDNNSTSILKTIKIISQIIEDRQKQIDTKNDIIHKLTKIESEQTYSFDKAENLNLKIKDLNSKIDFFKNKLNLQEKKYEKEIDKITKEKEENYKSFIKISMKESQYKHEIKKLENVIEETKAKLKKYMNDNKEIRIVDNKNERLLINNNTIIFDNFLKNSPSIILNQVNYSKDFYALIFKSFNEKLKVTSQENTDLKECIKFLRDEINQYINFKKTILYQFSQESIMKDNIALKDCSGLINTDVFNLDFTTSKNEVLQLFNELIDNFRFLLIYDFYKIEPEKEFNFDEVRKNFVNKKYSLENIPYFKSIQSSVERLNLDKLIETKNNIDKSINKKIERKRSNDVNLNIPEMRVPDNNIADNIEDLEQDLDNNMNNIEEAFKIIEDELIDDIRKINEQDINIDEETN